MGKVVLKGENGETYVYENVFGYVIGNNLHIERLISDSSGLIQGTTDKICSHNKLYVNGNIKNIKGNQYYVRTPIKRVSDIVKKRVVGLTLTGNFKEVILLGVHSKLQGIFDSCEFDSNCFLQGDCNLAIAYNSVYYYKSA